MVSGLDLPTLLNDNSFFSIEGFCYEEDVVVSLNIKIIITKRKILLNDRNWKEQLSLLLSKTIPFRYIKQKILLYRHVILYELEYVAI